jgi:predicted acylesterase/phospholipase RssA
VPPRTSTTLLLLAANVVIARAALAVPAYEPPPPPPPPVALTPTPDDRPGPPFSLTISGGISLGAYEAGLNWIVTEWLKAKQAAAPAGEHDAGPLVGVTGASAGAVNALLTAMRWCEADRATSIEGNLFSRTWRDVGMDTLLPGARDAYAPADSKDRDWQPDFLLSRKNAFREVIARVKQKIAAGGYMPNCSVRLGLMVTKVHPRRISIEKLATSSQRFVVPLIVGTKDGQLRFSLNTDLLHDERQRDLMGETLWLPATLEAGVPVVSAADVIDAVLASSAHPSSFGPVKVHHCTPVSQCPKQYRVRAPARDCNALKGLLEAPPLDRKEDLVMCHEPFVDGGAFDNVPLGVAMGQAESFRFADGAPGGSLPVRYIYLDPNIRRETALQPECTPETGSDGTPPRDPIGELITFIGGMYASATDYELHNVLRNNHWNFTATRVVDEARELYDRTCAGASPPAGCPACKAGLDAAGLLVAGVNEAQEAGDAVVWRSRWGTFLETTTVALKRIEPAATDRDARRAWQRQLANVGDLRANPAAARLLQIPTRLPPITGAMLSHFAAFLDEPFRGYDYYAGIYDGLVAVAGWGCMGCPWDKREAEVRHWMKRLKIADSGSEAERQSERFLKLERELSAGMSTHHCPPPGDAPPPAPREADLPGSQQDKIYAALADPVRCGFDRGICFGDGNFERFLQNLAANGYRAASPIAYRAVTSYHDWWTEPGVRVADRFEDLRQARPPSASFKAPMNVAGSFASLFTRYWYDQAHDPFLFRPWSDHSYPIMRVLSPSMSVSTRAERYFSLGFVNYAVGWKNVQVEGDLSLRLGTVENDTPGKGFLFDVGLGAIDAMFGPAWVLDNPWFSTVQLRGGRAISSWGEEVTRPWAYELAFGILLNHVRFAFGVQNDKAMPETDMKHQIYFRVGLADIAGLWEGVF